MIVHSAVQVLHQSSAGTAARAAVKDPSSFLVSVMAAKSENKVLAFLRGGELRLLRCRSLHRGANNGGQSCSEGKGSQSCSK